MGAPLLPRNLADAWHDIPLPDWVCEIMGAEKGATALALGVPLEPGSVEEVDQRLLNYVVRLTQSREQGVWHLTAIAVRWPLGLDPLDVPWANRTKNCLRNEGLLEDTDALTRISIQELSWIDNLGVRSILDFAVTGEAAAMQMEMLLPTDNKDDQGKLESQMKYLISAAQQPWAEQIGSSDPRFSDVFPQGLGSLSSRIESAVEAVDAKAIAQLANYLPAIENRITELAALPLEDSLAELFKILAPRQISRMEALMKRLGWSGEPPITLEACGEMLNVTRERVRQIQAKIILRLPNGPIFLPQLDKAIRVIEKAAPLPASAAPNLLIEAAICQQHFSAESVIAAASDLQRETSLKVRKIKGEKVLVADEDERSTNRMFAIARSQSGASGATNVSEVLAQLEAEEGVSIDSEIALALLQNYEQIDFLDDQWFWMSSIPEGRNRLRNITRRMLSVASPISVSKLRGGMRREYSFRNSAGSFKWTLLAPPINILLEWYKRHPEFLVDESENIRHVAHLESKKELGEVDLAIVEVLRSTPTCVLDRASIRNACLSRGINPHSLEIAMTYSAVVDHVETNIWTLRGVSVEPVAISAVREMNAQKPRQKRVRDFGWTAGGNIWISVITPEYAPMSVFGVPGGVKKILASQKFRAVSANGKEFGTVGITDDGTAYGYQPFLKQSGADEGDMFILEFDLESESVILRLGDESLLDTLV